jgi:hypothetical protein
LLSATIGDAFGCLREPDVQKSLFLFKKTWIGGDQILAVWQCFQHYCKRSSLQSPAASAIPIHIAKI